MKMLKLVTPARCGLFISAALLLACTAVTTRAAIIFQKDFEADTVGALPANMHTSSTTGSTIDVVTTQARSGTKALRLKLQYASSATYRSEIVPDSVTYFYDVEYWVGFSQYLKDWTADSHAEAVLQGHHGTPPNEPTCGSGSDNYAGYVISGNYEFRITKDPPACATSNSGVPGSSGRIGSPLSTTNLSNQWVDWVIHFKATESGTGFYEVWRNGVLFASVSNVVTATTNWALCCTPIEADRKSYYPKFGLYKWSWGSSGPGAGEPSVREMYMDEIRIWEGSGGSYAAVAPGSGGGTAPTAPSGLSASATAYNQINLTWTDNSGNETGFKVERKKGASGTYAQIGTTGAFSGTGSYNDTTAGTGTNYTYRVRAYNAQGDSAYSAEANATTSEVTGRRGHWKLDNGSGTTTTDSSGNSNTGTLAGGPTWTTGQIGGGLSFDGVDDVVNAGSGATLDNLPALTLSAWIKPTTMGENNLGRIFQKGTGGDPAAGFRLLLNASGAIEFAVDYATADLSRVAVTGTIGTGTWRHLLATWDGSTVGSNMHLYLDGAEVSYASTGNASGARGDDSAANLQIGATSTGSGTFNGVLDDLRVYNRVLNASEIQSVYRAGVP